MNSTQSIASLESILMLDLEYVNRREELFVKKRASFSSTTTIYDVTKKLLETGELDFIHLITFNLVSFCLNEEHYSVPFPNAHKTLYELKIENGSILRFEPSFSQPQEELLHSIIWGPRNDEKIDYSWNEATTTLGILLEDVIKAFHLESIEQKRIRLGTTSDEEIDFVANSHKKLSSLGLKNDSTIWIKLIDFPRNENICGDVICVYSDGTPLLHISLTDTTAKLIKQIEGRLLIVHEVYIETNEKLNLNDGHRSLEELGVKSGQTIYANPQLRISTIGSSVMSQSPNKVRPPAPNMNQQKVIVQCKISSTKTVTILASIGDTVAELTEKIASYKEDQGLAQFELRAGTIVIDDAQPRRCLADFGIKSGSTIEAKMFKFNPSSPLVESKPVVSSHRLPIGLKNRNNSCFMNSALQCLAHVMPLTRYFLKSIDRTQRNVKNPFYSSGEVTGAYAELLCKLHPADHSHNAFTPGRIRTAIGRRYPSFATGDEQDAEEFLTALLNTIDEELHTNNPPDRKTIIEKLFFGEMKSMTTCLQCNHVKTKIERLPFLSLPLSRQQREFTIEFHSKNGHQTESNVLVLASGRIEHLVKAFIDKRRRSDLFNRVVVQTTVTEEPLDLNSPLYMLTDSKVRLIEQKKRLIGVQLNQLDMNPNKISLDECLQEFFSIEYLEDSWYCGQKKCRENTNAVKQLQLHTLPPVLIIQLKRFASENARQKKVKTLVDYPINGFDLRDLSTSPDAIYDLIAVSNHTGSMRHGHYTAYARQKVSTDLWYKFDDALVSPISSNTEIVTADAYLLFYMKRNY